MDLNSFVLLVAGLAVAYTSIVIFVQQKLTDKKAMDEMQQESKRLSDEYKKAQEAKDKAKMEEITQKQLDFLPKMNGVMFGQFKVMFVVLAIFFTFNWLVGYIDPTVKDDILVKLKDDGKGCDLVAADHIYSACYGLANNTNYGKWMVDFKLLKDGAEIGQNSTYIVYNSDNVSDTFVEGPKNEPFGVSTDKLNYDSGQTIKIFANDSGTKGTEVDATLNNGTEFYVDLPITIPIINVKRIHQPYWWFILISLITNITVSTAMGRYSKRP